MLNKRLPGFSGVVSRVKGAQQNSVRPVVQPKTFPRTGAKPAIQPKAAPVAPPVYRPQPIPRVLQTKQAIHKGPVGPNAPAITSVRPSNVRPQTVQPSIRPSVHGTVRPQPQRPGAPAVKSVAPPVYRPNPQPHVVQRRTVIQPARPPAISVHMKAACAARPPQVQANAGVVQGVIVIKQYGKKNKERRFTVKNSRSDSTRHKSADFLISRLDKYRFAPGWISHVRDMVGDSPPTPDHEYNTIKDLATDIGKTFPPMDEKKKRKRDRVNEISRKHKKKLRKLDSNQYEPGKKLRLGSFVGASKLIEELSRLPTLQQNITDLTTNFHPTPSGGKSLELETGNIYQDYVALLMSNLGNDVKGAYLEKKYHRINDGLGVSPGIRQDPFVELSDRLKCTVTHGDGAYKQDEIPGDELVTFENIRLPENTVPLQFRHMLVEDNQLEAKKEYNPIGPYALSEIPGATKGKKLNNRLMDQNAFTIYERVKTIDNTTVIGNNTNLPQGTNQSTLTSYITSFDNVRKQHTQQTQNEFHKQNFYVARSMFGPFYDENDSPFVPKTPPGSPFNQDYGYDQ
jgi:hypothetical protein